MSQVLFKGMKICPLVGVRGCSAPECKFAAPHISETTRAKKLKFYTHLDGARYENFSARVVWEGAAPPSVNLGTLISRKLLEVES